MEGLTVPSPSVGYPRRLSLRWVLRRSGRAGRTLVYIPCLAALDGLGAERRGGPGGHLGHGRAEAAPVIAAAGRCLCQVDATKRDERASGSAKFYMGTLLASSGSPLGHAPTTRTHACRRPPKRERGRPRHTRTHTIYAVRQVYSAGVHPVASPPSPVSTPVGFGVTRRVRTEPPHPSFSSPESACASGTGVAAATVCSSVTHVQAAARPEAAAAGEGNLVYV